MYIANIAIYDDAWWNHVRHYSELEYDIVEEGFLLSI